MAYSDTASSLKVDIFTYENGIRAEHVLSVYNVPGFLNFFEYFKNIF